MAKHISEESLQAIENAVRAHSNGATTRDISKVLKAPPPFRTLQYHLKYLVDNRRLIKKGGSRWVRYHISTPGTRQASLNEPLTVVPFSKTAAEIQIYVRRPMTERKPVGYNRAFLDSYRPNITAYLTEQERAHLKQIGMQAAVDEPAGSYAKQILNRLLIDLSWNSSRLEGNTYSLLDTKRLIDFGQEAEGKEPLETQMILNHKDAIEFLVNSAGQISFNRYTILNLHAILANNLLPDPNSPGRLRRIPFGIGRSVYVPLEIPQLIEECFDQLLTTAAAIYDPFEQSLFVMTQLPYLQPFDDVNKRVSRLAANISLIKSNLSPLSFIDVPLTSYTEAVLGVYELNKFDLLKDVFIWAYERSAARYVAVRQSIGEPDRFRLRHRLTLREAILEIVRGKMTRKQALAHLTVWTEKNIDPADRDKFKEIAEDELISLHEGSFARYQILPSEFEVWQKIWNE